MHLSILSNHLPFTNKYKKIVNYIFYNILQNYICRVFTHCAGYYSNYNFGWSWARSFISLLLNNLHAIFIFIFQALSFYPFNFILRNILTLNVNYIFLWTKTILIYIGSKLFWTSWLVTEKCLFPILAWATNRPGSLSLLILFSSRKCYKLSTVFFFLSIIQHKYLFHIIKCGIY